MSQYGAAREIRYQVTDLIRSPNRMSVLQLAREKLKVLLPNGNYGAWDDKLVPYLWEPMELLTSRHYEAVIFVGPARTGKTVMLEGFENYSIMADPSDFLTIHTSQETARKYSRQRIDRRIRYTPELRERLSTARGNDNIFDKRFKAGNVLGVAWPSIRQLSSFEYKRIACSDYDRRDTDDVDGEGSLFNNMLKRTTTFMSSGMALIESSPGFEVLDPRWQGGSEHEMPPAEGIASYYNLGDRRRFYWCCPHCSTYFIPSHEHFVFPDHGDPSYRADNMTYAAPCCGSVLKPEEKRSLNANGKWFREGEKLEGGEKTGKPRTSKYASFWLSSPCASYQTWNSIAFKLLAAEEEYARTGSEENLKAVWGTDLAVPYVSRSRLSQRTAEVLQERSEPLDRGCVPEGVRFIIASIDIQAGQRRGFVVQFIGLGVGLESWLLDRFSIRHVDKGKKVPIDPAGRVEDWDVIVDQVIKRTFPLGDDSGRRMPVTITVCDSGGEKGVTDRAYRFYRKLKKLGLTRRFMLVKGRANGKRIHETYPDNTERSDRKATAKGDVPVWLINTNEIKDAVSSDMDREQPGPGYMHFPDWVPSWFYDELTAEIRGSKGWEPVTERAENEALDLYVYTKAACYKLKADRVNWSYPSKPWARDWDGNPDIIIPTEQNIIDSPINHHYSDDIESKGDDVSAQGAEEPGSRVRPGRRRRRFRTGGSA